MQARTIVIGQNLKSQLDRLFSLGIPLNELVGFDEQCKEVVTKYKDVRSAMVVDLAGRIIFHNDRSQINKAITDKNTLSYINGDKDDPLAIRDFQQHDYNIVIPIFDINNRRIGAVIVKLPLEAILQKTKALIRYSAVVAIITLILGIGLLFSAINLWVNKPLTKLLLAIEEIGRKGVGFKGRVEVNSKDELGKLAHSFNRMTEDLQKITVSRDELIKEINERKRVEEALRNSEERFRQVASSSLEWIWEVDAGGRYTYSSPVVKDILGYKPEEVLGKYYYDFFVPEDKEQLMQDAKAAFEQRGTFSFFINRNLRKDGHIVILETSGVPLFDARGDLLGYRGVDRDITERKKAEERLQRVNRALKMISECNQAMIRVKDELEYLQKVCQTIVEHGDYHSCWVGFAFQDEAKSVKPVAWAGFEKGYLESLNITWQDTEGGRGPAGTAIRTGKPCIVKNILTDPNYAPWREEAIKWGYASCIVFPLSFSAESFGVLNIYASEPEIFDEEEVGLLTELSADVIFGVVALRTQAERKSAEEALEHAYEQLKTTQAQLVQSAKMASVGLLAGGVAHEINNPLTGVLNNVQLIRLMAGQRKDFNLDDFKTLLAVIEDSAQRCTKITRSLLDFSRASKGIFQKVSLNDITEKVISLIEHELRLENIIIQKDLAPDITLISGDLQLLQQVVFDIISNAKWAIKKKTEKEGGLITVKSEYNTETKQAFLYISDTGIGIPEENLERIFEPFFTTKSVGEGTGLGLSIVYNIIKQHNGTIEVESEVGKGATFKISLPAST
jgi:PAS domain S-box-containing protein